MKVVQLIKKMQCCSNCEIILIPRGAPKETMDAHFLKNPEEYSEGDATIDTFNVVDNRLEIFCH